MKATLFQDTDFTGLKQYSDPYIPLEQSLITSAYWLDGFLNQDDLLPKLHFAFGSTVDANEAKLLTYQLASENPDILPRIEVRHAAEIGGAKGAFSGSNYTIYLSQGFLEQNSNNQGAIVNVLLEELGHSIDWKLHPGLDTPGDEGELFSDLVRGVQLNKSELQRLKTENDRITVTLDGQIVELEQSAAQASFPDSLLKPSGIIVENQGNVFERLPGSVIPPSTIFANNSLSGTGEPSFVPLSIDLQNRLTANAQTATIQVTYHDFTPQAQAAFDYAVKIWSSIIVAAVPITIDAYYEPLAPGVLGQGGPNSFFRAIGTPPPGVQPNTWYTSAIANQFAGQDLDPNDTDITSSLSSNFNWYFGTDGKTPPGQYDLVTVALGEILHGLGTIGLMQYGNGQGSWGDGTGYPAIYDRFIENGAGQSLVNTNLFPNPSFALGNQLTSNDLFFDGANAVGANSGNRPKLYAPSIWQDVSSIYHLDENTYPQGNPNSLNTPFLNAGESIHDPGPITRGILKDEGWYVVPPVPTLTPPLDTPLFRFQNTSVPGTYLFAGAEEAASIRQNYKNFREEGFAFGVATNQTDPLLQPFYRFQNTSSPGTYLYAGAQEAASIRQNYKNFHEEGLAFYAYGAGVGMGTTFNRFQNTSLPGTYLFAGPSETESILANYPNFHLEGIAFEAGG